MKTQIKNIHDMDTASIIWHLVYRHRVVLLIAGWAMTFTAWMVTSLPPAVHNFVK